MNSTPRTAEPQPEFRRLADRLILSGHLKAEDVIQETPKLGRYEVIRSLGRGAAGQVFLALDPVIGREVAIKLLDKLTSSSVERFNREIRAIASLKHPGVVEIYDAGIVGENRPYYVMEFVGDATLDDAGLPLEQTVKVLEQVVRACQAAHRQGIVHRDLKPSNILLGERPVVADFGVAKILGADKALTAKGSLVGTPAYMAPEQICDGEIGPWTDVYALGVILYEAMTGQLPWEFRSVIDLTLKIVNEPPKAPREVDPRLPGELERVVLRALSKDPVERQTAQELADALKDWLASGARRSGLGVGERLGRVGQGWIALLALGAVGVGAGLALLTGLAPTASDGIELRLSGSAQPQAPEPQAPEPQAHEPQAHESQESRPQAPEPQEPEPQEPEPQAPEPQAPEPQAPEPQAPEPQAPEPQEPKTEAERTVESVAEAISDWESRELDPRRGLATDELQDLARPLRALVKQGSPPTLRQRARRLRALVRGHVGRLDDALSELGLAMALEGAATGDCLFERALLRWERVVLATVIEQGGHGGHRGGLVAPLWKELEADLRAALEAGLEEGGATAVARLLLAYCQARGRRPLDPSRLPAIKAKWPQAQIDLIDGQLHLLAGQRERAIALLTTAKPRRSCAVFARCALALAYRAQAFDRLRSPGGDSRGLASESLRSAVEALELTPRSREVHRVLVRACEAVSLAWWFAGVDASPDVLGAVSRGLASLPGGKRARSQGASALIARGSLEHLQGALGPRQRRKTARRNAKQHFEDAVKLDAEAVEPWMMLALLELMRTPRGEPGDGKSAHWSAARRAMDEAVSRAPRGREVMVFRRRILAFTRALPDSRRLGGEGFPPGPGRGPRRRGGRPPR